MSASTPRSSCARAASNRSRPKATASSSGAGPSSRLVAQLEQHRVPRAGRELAAHVRKRLLERAPAVARVALGHVDLADQPPCLCEAAFVALALEHLDRRAGLRRDLLRMVGLGLDQEPDSGPPHPRVGLHTAVAARAGGFDRALVHLLGPCVLRVALQRLADQWAAARCARSRSPAAGRRRVPGDRRLRCPRVPARNVRPPPPAAARLAVQARTRAVRSAQVGVVAIRVLEVVADDRLQLDHPLGVAALEPVARRARAGRRGPAS